MDIADWFSASLGEVNARRPIILPSIWRKRCSLMSLGGNLHMAMLTTAFDAGGHESDQPFMVVAGFISTAANWINFSRDWRARLTEAGIRDFHMHKFLHPKHRPLVRDLADIILRHSFRKFSVIVKIEAIPPSFRTFRLNAYALAGRIAAANVTMWQLQEWPASQVEYVFEDGDKGKGLLMEKMRRDGYPDPIFRPRTDRVGKSGISIPAFLPLQGADILA